MIADMAAENGWHAFSYIDDQLLVMHAGEADSILQWFLSKWKECGWEVSEKKLREAGPPSVSLTFLGVMINTAEGTASISPARLEKMKVELNQWASGVKTPDTNMQNLRQLAGILQFVSATIPFSQVYMRAIYEAQHQLHRHLDVQCEAQWWLWALHHLNGTARISIPHAMITYHHLSTDASKIGWGWYAPSLRIFGSGKWRERERHRSSTAHWEAAAIVFAIYGVARTAAGTVLVVHTDSEACFHAFSQCKCHDAKLLTLLRMAVTVQIRFGITLLVRWIPGSDNRISDAFSRGEVHHIPMGWSQKSPTTDERYLGGLLCLKSRSSQREEQYRQILRSSCSPNTASHRTTSPQPMPAWMCWNSLRVESPVMDVWCTWPSGFDVRIQHSQ